MKYRKAKKKIKLRMGELDLKLLGNPFNMSAHAEYKMLVCMLADLRKSHETKTDAKTA